jgi:hypothetical protein
MLEVTRRELEKAYRGHRGHYGQCSSHTHCLLLVYCVECGLKALLMRYHRVDRYTELPASSQVSHDLRDALMLLRAPANLVIRPTKTAHARVPQQPVASRELHQAFRYGIAVESQADVTADLEKIVTWIEERL